MDKGANEVREKSLWNPGQTYTMAAVCLLIGLAIGYFLRGSASQPVPVAAGPSRILNLTIGNETFSGLAADEDTMERLTRFAVRAQLRSSGRKPGWAR